MLFRSGKVRSMDGPSSNADDEGLPANMWFEVVLSNGKKAAVRPAPCSDECLLGMDNEFQRLHVLGFVDMAGISPKYALEWLYIVYITSAKSSI